MTKRPAFQFYPSDWRTDPGLRLCSIAARGLWAEMLCIMHEAEPYGHLTLSDGREITIPMLARLVGESRGEVSELLDELGENGVFSRTEHDIIFSRRMVRDEAVRNARAAGGHLGAPHGEKGKAHGAKGGRPKKAKPPLLETERGDNLPPPSSSSSSSSSSSPSVVEEDVDARASDEAEFEAIGDTDAIDADGTPTFARQCAEAAGVAIASPNAIRTAIDLTRTWRAAGAEPDEIIACIKQGVANAPEPIHSLRYFEAAIRQTVARRRNGVAPSPSRPTGKRSAWVKRND